MAQGVNPRDTANKYELKDSTNSKYDVNILRYTTISMWDVNIPRNKPQKTQKMCVEYSLP